MEEILKAVASGLKLDAEQFLADFKNGDDFISEKDAAAKLAAFIPDKVKAANETAKKVGRSEVQKRFSRLITQSGFENPESLEGEPLFTAFLEWKGEQTQHIDGDPAKLSKDELLKLPIVKNIVQEVTAKAGEKFSAEKAEFEKKIKAAENTRKGILLEKNLLSILEKGKVNLGETPETKAVRLDFLKSRVNLDRVEIGDGDALKFLGEDGYEADFEKEFLPVAVTAFGVVTQDKNKGGSGAQGSGSGAGNGKTGPTFTFASEADFNTQFFKASAQDRAVMLGDWKSQQDKAAGNAG